MSRRGRGSLRGGAEPPAFDADLFPPAFLRILAAIPSAVARLRAGASEGRRAAPGEGGRFLFRGHRAYRPGDDLRRVDWKAAARTGRTLVRQFDAERDVLTEVWLDGSASMGPEGGRVKSARVAALSCALGLAAGGRTRLGLLQAGAPRPLVEAQHAGRLGAFLEALSAARPEGRARLHEALGPLVRRVPRRARLLLVSDLLTSADPGVLHALAGRGLRGAIVHLRVPAVHAPDPVGLVALRDVETGAERMLRLDAALAGRIAARAREHAARWSRRAAAVGLSYVPVAPRTPDDAILRRLVEATS